MAHWNRVTAPGELVEMGRDLDRGTPGARREGDGGALVFGPGRSTVELEREALQAGRRAFDLRGHRQRPIRCRPLREQGHVGAGRRRDVDNDARAAGAILASYRLDGERRTLAESNFLRYPRCGRCEGRVLGGGGASEHELDR